MTISSVYLDYAATTPIDPRVAKAMWPYLTSFEYAGNAGSSHLFGQRAKAAIEHARFQVAGAMGAEPSEIIWTSGATEANNLAVRGAAYLYQNKGKHIITCKTEHASILDCCRQLEKEGFDVSYLTPLPDGLIDLNELKNTIRSDTILVAISAVNNELGTVQDLASIAEITNSHDILLHVDAAQAIGKIPLDIKKLPIQLMSVCAHKVYGPQGVGALYLRKKPRVRVKPLFYGGGQEQGMRSGTLATHQIVGMGEAFAIATKERESEVQRISKLNESLFAGLLKWIPIIRNSSLVNSMPHFLNLQFPNFKAKDLLNQLPFVAIARGSACHAKGDEPSYVLRAIGLSNEAANSSIRISLGRFTTQNEITFVVNAFKKICSTDDYC